MITPDHRAAIHEAIDQAINLGAIATIGIHPRYVGDGVKLRHKLERGLRQRGDFREGDSEGHLAGHWWMTYQVGTFSLSVHDGHRFYSDRPEPEGNPLPTGEVTCVSTPHGGAGYVEATGPARPVEPNPPAPAVPWGPTPASSDRP